MVLNVVLKVYYQKDIHIKCLNIFGNNVQVITKQSLFQNFVFYLITNLILVKKEQVWVQAEEQPIIGQQLHFNLVLVHNLVEVNGKIISSIKLEKP